MILYCSYVFFSIATVIVLVRLFQQKRQNRRGENSEFQNICQIKNKNLIFFIYFKKYKNKILNYWTKS